MTTNEVGRIMLTQYVAQPPLCKVNVSMKADVVACIVTYVITILNAILLWLIFGTEPG